MQTPMQSSLESIVWISDNDFTFNQTCDILSWVGITCGCTDGLCESNVTVAACDTDVI